MSKKYEIVEDVKLKYAGKTLYLIRALRDFKDVHKGDLGGWIESESNLSSEGSCWVYDNAKVFGNARITGHASVHDSAIITGESTIRNRAKVGDHTIITNCSIGGDATVSDNAIITGEENSPVRIRGNACIFGSPIIHGDSILLEGRCYIHGNALLEPKNNSSILVSGEARIYGKSVINGGTIQGNARIDGGVIKDNATVSGNACIKNHAIVCKQARVTMGEYTGANTVIDTSITTMKFKKCIDIWVSSGDSIKVGINEDNDLIICLGNDPYIPIHAISEVYTGHNAKILQTAVELAKLDLYKKED